MAMRRPLRVAAVLLAGLAGIGDGRAQELPPTPAGDVASQRQWLLQQVRIGEAMGRQDLIENALARLRLLEPDDRSTLLAIMETQLSMGRIDDAGHSLQRLRAQGQGSAELRQGLLLWEVYAGERQDELREARLLAARDQTAEALAIYRRLFDDKPPGLSLGVEYWRLRGSEASARPRAIRELQALERAYPNNPFLLQALARLLFAADRDNEALAALQRVGRIQGMQSLAAQSEWNYLVSQPADARSVARLAQFIARYPTWTRIDDVRALHAEHQRKMANPAWRSGREGLRLLDAGRNAEAERAFRHALRGFPGEADFIGGLGMALMRQGQRAQALALFDKAARAVGEDGDRSKWNNLIASTRYWLLLEQAEAALQAGEPDRAEALYRQARRQQPREVNAVLGLLDVALARGDDAAAAQQLQAARRIAPRDANVIRKQVQFLGRTNPAQLETYVAALPAAQRRLYAEELRNLRLSRLHEQREQALAAGDALRAIALGRALRTELPEDPWLAYALGNELRAIGAQDEADAVVADMAARAGDTPVARYAQALYLSGSDRRDAALAALHTLPAEQWDEDMQALAARIERQQLVERAWELRAQGHEAEAIALLQRQPPDAGYQLMLGDWARLRGDHAQARAYYAQVLETQPDNVDAQLGRLQVLIDSGDSTAARAQLADTPLQPAALDLGQRRQLAAVRAGLGENADALALLRGVLADKTEPDPQAWRDAARLLRANDAVQALDMYARAMAENGLLLPAQAQPRDDRALTRASRETTGDDWLRSSLRRDVETLYQQQNPTLTVMQDSGRRSDGTPGISRLSRDTRIVHLDAPFAGGLGWARVEQVRLDARSFQADGNGAHDNDFGSCSLNLRLADGSTLRAPGCDTHLRQRVNSGAGLAVGWRTLDERWSFDLGHTPSGYAVGNWLGGVTVNGDLGRFGWGATLSRRPMSNSLLSQAGAVDPRSGIAWGGVTANGVTFSLGYDQGGRNGLWSNWGWHHLSGHNVADNTRARAMAGWYHKLVQRPDMRLDVGLTAMYWRYAHDLGGYSLGQGGYYSPQRYTSLGVPVGFAWRNDDWSVRVDASLSASSARTEASDRFPVQAVNARVLAALEAHYGPLALDETGRYSSGGSSSGSGHRLYAAVERRLGDHFVLGVAGTLQRSQDYSPNTFQLYLRYTLQPWQGNLPLPVSPLQPYGEFR